MKKSIWVCLVALITGLTFTATAQQRVCPGQSPTIVAAGSFNSSTLGGGTAYSATPITYTGDRMPLYTKTTTVTNTGTDTVKCKLTGEYSSVYVWSHATSLTGTNTSCTIKLYASADSGRGVDFVPLQTFTVSATNPVANYMFNSGSGWPYTNFWLVFIGSGTHTTNWYSGMMVR